jgi:hypothetical protein
VSFITPDDRIAYLAELAFCLSFSLSYFFGLAEQVLVSDFKTLWYL